jgi:hypothetical protein
VAQALQKPPAMTARLDGWLLTLTSDGALLVPPEGGEAAAISIHEGLRPLGSIPGIVALATEPVETLVTDEGEHAAFVIARGGGVERALAVVIGDDGYTLIDGRTAQPGRAADVRAAVRRLAVEHTLGLGERRRRRFRYTPPAGWAGSERGMTAIWRAPGGDATLTVAPARPAGARLAGLEAMIAELERVAHAERVALPLIVAPRLAGNVWRACGAGRHTVEAALHDDRFDYRLRLDVSGSGGRAHEDAFAAVLRSIEPVPRPRGAATTEISLHWAS